METLIWNENKKRLQTEIKELIHTQMDMLPPNIDTFLKEQHVTLIKTNMFHMARLMKEGLGKSKSEIDQAMLDFEKANHKLAVDTLKSCFRS